MTSTSLDPLAHRDAKFINTLYYTPVGMLMQMDRDQLRYSLARAELVCHWLEGILELMEEFEAEGK